jgi:CRISPR-associated endonuclease/helicase Cas3
MGGADAGAEWNLYPEECAVLIGTQDMLLSRALNRGYAAGRARWPFEFGLLSHDALWVMDEVQLMDVGLATSAQLQAFHDQDARKGFKPRHTWWMSATLQPEWLRSVDTAERQEDWCRDACSVSPSQRGLGLGTIKKSLALDAMAADDKKALLASRVLEEHENLADGDYGRITLVVCNTVQRACSTYDDLRKLAPEQSIDLVHSRFRPAERSKWREAFLSRDACRPGVNRIIVATQVVEAGVDISAGCLVTDLAPWPSLVQRFGRCARYGGNGHVVVIDRGRDEGDVAPYSIEECEGAWLAIKRLADQDSDVSVATLEEFEDRLTPDERSALYPYEPRHLLVRREFDELFDTTPDLSGADLDISRFIRTGDERDLQVFWVDVPRAKKAERAAPDPKRTARREELCSIPFLAARKWLCGEESKGSRKPRLLAGKRAWVWDWIDGEWREAERTTLTPGRLVCVDSESGGYRPTRGFDPEFTGPVEELRLAPLPPSVERQSRSDTTEEGEDLSRASDWKTIGCHVGEVADEARRIARALTLDERTTELLELVGRWHDLGKAHPAFQGRIRGGERRPPRDDLAKAPDGAWSRHYRSSDGRDERPGLRHELASALALFAVLQKHAPFHEALLGPWQETFDRLGQPLATQPADSEPTACERAILDCTAEEFDLLVYLVAAHHGKVRLALHAGPRDQDYDDRDGRGLPIRGVREGDVLPAIALGEGTLLLPSLRLTLEPASLGLSSRTGRSWRERTSDLSGRYGPGALAWLEALIVAADRRASRLETADPALGRIGEVPR